MSMAIYYKGVYQYICHWVARKTKEKGRKGYLGKTPINQGTVVLYSSWTTIILFSFRFVVWGWSVLSYYLYSISVWYWYDMRVWVWYGTRHNNSNNKQNKQR